MSYTSTHKHQTTAAPLQGASSQCYSIIRSTRLSIGPQIDGPVITRTLPARSIPCTVRRCKHPCTPTPTLPLPAYLHHPGRVFIDLRDNGDGAPCVCCGLRRRRTAESGHGCTHATTVVQHHVHISLNVLLPPFLSCCWATSSRDGRCALTFTLHLKHAY